MGARKKKTISNLSSDRRSALGREGARPRLVAGASKGTGAEQGGRPFRSSAARLRGSASRAFKDGQGELIRAVGEKRRSRSSWTSPIRERARSKADNPSPRRP